MCCVRRGFAQATRLKETVVPPEGEVRAVSDGLRQNTTYHHHTSRSFEHSYDYEASLYMVQKKMNTYT